MFKRVIQFAFLDFLFVLMSYVIMAFFKESSIHILTNQIIRPFLAYSFIWIFISFLSGKYSFIHNLRIYDYLINLLVANFFTLSLLLNIIFIFKFEFTSRGLLFGTAILATIGELIAGLVYYMNPKVSEIEDLRKGYISTSEELQQEEIKPVLDFAVLENPAEAIVSDLKNQYLNDKPKLFEWISSKINLLTIRKNESYILHTHSLFNIQHIMSQSEQLFVNLHRINDTKRINQFFIKVNQNLKYGGFYIGTAITNEVHYEYIHNRFPKLVANLYLALIHYPLKRVLPKLPITKQFYFALTRGRNRAISRAEVLGRLYSCGFEVLAETIIDEHFYFVARKIKEPIEDQSPTYGPLIKLRRVGKNGKILNIYKFRTMHPFSEFLQEYVYKLNSLQEGGKFKDDFRVTSMGKFMRKIWLDELPMIYNMLKGEIKLVGVRPLSLHFFNLYSEELKAKRLEHRPGLIPPFYVDMPKTLDEIQASEMKYLLLSDKSPYLTDFKYFFLSFYNILIKRARSN